MWRLEFLKLEFTLNVFLFLGGEVGTYVTGQAQVAVFPNNKKQVKSQYNVLQTINWLRYYSLFIYSYLFWIEMYNF